MKVQSTLRPLHYWLCFLTAFVVAGGIYLFSIGFNYEIGEEGEEEEEAKEEVLQAFDLWSDMRTYPAQQMEAGGYASEFRRAKLMSLEARSGRLGLNAPSTAPWSELGPWNFSGRILSMAIHPTNNNIMFAGSASGGLWKTTTGGSAAVGSVAWSFVPTGFPVLGVASIAINPSTPNTMFIGTGEVYNTSALAGGVIGSGHIRTFRGSYGIGILKSVDGGVTWTQSLAFAQSATEGVMDLVIHPTNTNIIFAATTDGVYRSTDNGSNWTLVHNIPMAMSLAFKADDPNILFVGSGNFSSTGAGVYRCANTTAATPTFTKLGGGLPTTISGKIQLAVTPANASVIYASIGNDPANAGDPHGLWKSTDAGTSWTKMNGGTSIIGNQGWYGHSVGVSVGNANTVIWGELNTYASSNGGTSFSNTGIWSNWDINKQQISNTMEGINANYVHADVHRIVPHPSNAATLFVLTDGGIFKTTNSGSTWTTINGGLNTSQIYANISASTVNPDFMLCGLQDNEAMVYEGAPGCRRVGNLGDGFHTAIKPGSNTCFVESYYFNRRRSTNLGTTWGGSSGQVAEVACFNVPFVYSGVAGSDTMFAGTIYLKRSWDGGVTWANLNSGVAVAGPQNPMIHIAAPNRNLVYFSSAPSTSPALRSKLWKATNSGATITEITGTLPDRYYSHIAVDPTNPNRIAVTLSGFGSSHVFLSTNAGTSWCDIGAGLPDVPTNTVMFQPNDPATIYIGNDLGVYYAHAVPTGIVGSSYTLSWTAYNEGFTDAIMVSDIMATSTNMIRLGSYGRGLWERAFAPPATLPARVVSFTGSRQGKTNRLEWTSSMEVNVSRYVVEYSSDGMKFSDIGTVTAAGNSNNPRGYSFDHVTTPGAAYYRIRIVDVDGLIEYTQVVSLKGENNTGSFSLFPNPTTARTTVHIAGGNTGTVNYRVVDMGGQTVLSGKYTLTGGAQDLPLDLANRPAGMYHVVLDGQNVHWTGKLVKR